MALLVGAISLYTPPTDVPAPPYATIELDTAFPVQFIFYTVRQLSPTIAQVTMQVALYKTAAPPSKAPAAGIGLILPPDALFRTCPRLYCSRTFDRYEWRQALQFSPFNYGRAPALETAFVNLFVRAHSFGQASNGATAAAAMPNIRIGNFPTTPSLATQYTSTLLTRYYIPSANSYDWAAFPPSDSNGALARWSEQFSSGQLDARTAVGINLGKQSADFNKTFFAGALLGLAGAALLSAIQEALHAND